jgi:hypothetical protein
LHAQQFRQEENKVNKHSIIPTPGIAQTAAVAAAYIVLETALEDAQTAATLVKEANGNLCESADFIPAEPSDDIRWNNQGEYYRTLRLIEEKKLEKEHRRITLYGCKLRAMQAITDLYGAREALVLAVNAVRDAVDQVKDEKLKLQADAARCNVFYAEALLLNSNRAARAHSKALSYGVGIENAYAGNGAIDLRASLNAEYERLSREWTVMFSGHGSKFRFEGGDGTEVPAGPYLTIDEARADGIDWECSADTIGGRACLYNVRTKKDGGRF